LLWGDTSMPPHVFTYKEMYLYCESYIYQNILCHTNENKISCGSLIRALFLISTVFLEKHTITFEDKAFKTIQYDTL
jgi:hypothetical protein